ncbi:MAG: NAD-dependent epimerase/dehydratase family protein [Kofleriaceae bacterium]
MKGAREGSQDALVVVTGGAGFIGSHTVDGLIAAGRRVVVLDNFSTGRRANLARWADARYRFDGAEPALEVAVVDVAHGLFAALAPITAKHGPVGEIIHLAAQVSVVHSVANPLVDMQVNYGGTLHVLEYARATGVRKVVLASSAAIYGDVAALPVAETADARPLSPYGIDKYASELALAYYQATFGLATASLRFFNVYGPRQDPSSPYSGVISIFADRARAGRPLVIFGDGAQTRDFVYVGDVARAILAAATSAGGQPAINVGTGRAISINELAQTVVELCGGRSDIQHAAARPGEIQHSVAAVQRLEAELGLRAETQLSQGLAATLSEA